MQSLMPAEAYIDEGWYAREQALLMRPLWQFVAPRMLLRKHHAFVTRRVAGIDVVVQNFDGELKAFENVCLHRQNPLQQQPHGVRPLVCSYHGWGYDAQGGVANIPFHDSVYRLPEAERACLHLRQFAVACLGELVFVNVSDTPLPLDQQFSPEAMATLAQACAHFDSEVLIATLPMRCNWKLAYENLRDSLHPRYLHQQSVYQQVKFQVQMPDEAELAAARHYHRHGSASRDQHLARLRSFSSGGANEPLEQMPQFAWHDNVARYGDADWYYNWLLYPNLHIVSGSGGYSFSIEHHQPVSAARTDLTVYMFTARKTRRYPTSAAVLLSHLEGAERVLREDITVMENVQAALRPGGPRAVLGDFEAANLAVERWTLDTMEGRHAL